MRKKNCIRNDTRRREWNINEIKHRCIFIIFIGEKNIYKKRNTRAIPSLNSYFPFTLHTLVEKRGRDPSRFAPSVQYIPIEEEGKIPSSTIANLPKRFTRIHSSLLKFPRNDHSIVHGRPRIGAESSFTPTPYPLSALEGCVYRRGEESLFDIQLANEPSPPSLPLGWARLLQPLYLMPALSETRTGLVVTRIFWTRIHEDARLLYRDEMQFSSGQHSRESSSTEVWGCLSLYLHPRSFQLDAACFFRFFLFLSEKRNYSATLCVHRCILAVSTI